MILCFRLAIFVATLQIAFNVVCVADETRKFKLDAKRADDKTEFQVNDDTVTFAIRSPSGISKLVIERLDDAWPPKLVLQMHLKGLENLSITNSKLTLHTSISSSDGKQRLWKDKEEHVTLDSKSPFWFEVKILGQEHKPAPTIPLQSGYFEMQLPKVLFEDNPKSITVNWIDFYR